jgi:serine phosphatase RsbU (regulator of sigma subunit)
MATPPRKVATLQVISGPMAGWQFRLDRELTVIGRSPDCDVVLQSKTVSRRHAAITRTDRGFLLKDMGSTRGTSVNGRKLTQPVVLQDGNTIEAGEVLLGFSSHTVMIQEDDDYDSVLFHVMVEMGVDEPEANELGTNFREAASWRNSLCEECAQIRTLLATNHVKWDDAERHDLLDEVLKPDSSARRMLGEGFYRIAVLDATRGVGQGEAFDPQRFLAAVREEVVRVFGLRLDPRAFHIEDIFQMLKDEPRSLFCFANFQLIPLEHMRTVRSFTQGVHRVLLLTRGRRDLASEEGEALERAQRRQASRGDIDDNPVDESGGIREGSLSGVVVKPEAKLRALQQISQAFGTTLVLGELLEKVLDSLFEIFPRAERGFVLLREPGSSTLVPEAVRSRSGPAGEVSISKTVLNRVLNDGQAILSKDLPREFPESASVSDIRIRTLMCAPLLGQDRKPVGIMQIDTCDRRGPFDQDDLEMLVAVASQVSVVVQNAQLHRVLDRQRELEQELQFARQVQRALLPESLPSVPGYEFWVHYEPAHHVGGDYYGFIPIGQGKADEDTLGARWAIAVGEAVGKGMPAAMLTATLSGEVRLLLQGETDPARVVSRLNRQLAENGVLDMYITFLLAMLDITTHRLQVVNAGHPCPLIRRRDGRVEEFAKESSGLPLAIKADWVYETAETILEPGETVILYTDGVNDTMNAVNERFGEHRIKQTLGATPAGPTAVGEAILRAVRDHSAGRPQFDDTTLVIFGRQEAP